MKADKDMIKIGVALKDRIPPVSVACDDEALVIAADMRYIEARGGNHSPYLGVRHEIIR
jgi:hypothetical protein